MQGKYPLFIREIIDEVRTLNNGADLLSLLEFYGVTVRPSQEYTGDMIDAADIAFLHIDNGVNTLYLSPDCHADDMVHELTHIHHLFDMNKNFVTPEDLKHRYITKAMREADAFARQMEAFVETLHDPKTLEREQAVFKKAQLLSMHPDDDVDFYAGAGRLYLYTVLNTPPEEILRMIAQGEAAANDLMLDIFCVVLHDYIPLQYEEFHLDQLNSELNERQEENDTIVFRQAPCAFHSKEDSLFFAECLRQYGSWGRTTNYLVSPEGYGPDPSVFLDTLFNKNVTQVIDEMNAELQEPAMHHTLPPEEPEF